MALLVLKMSISLDGFIAASDGGSDWSAAGRSEDGGRWVADTIAGAEAHLIGGATYAEWTTFWPDQTGPIAEAMNELPKYVFSSSRTEAPWGPATIVGGDLAESVARLKEEQTGGYLLAQGGTRFARSLVRTGLIDEYRLVVHPVVLGAGEPLFEAPLALEPVSTTTFSRGGVAHVFTAHP